ncbi:MAG: porin, partial [Rhodobacteraceae bacterium]|nr:porin [Paracoccaceae bacterium]
MRKFMVFASALALSGSMALAMEEDAMDKASSVSVGGSGKIGIRNVDDSSKPDDGQFKLVRAYKVTFDSTGTTDGGLMFGAGMSIRDDTGEEDKPTVRGSYVFVGGGDGSWKLQFGGNDPGIDLA